MAGHEVIFESRAVRREIGYMPESVPLYGSMRVDEYLFFRACLKGLTRRDAKGAVDRCLSQVDLTKRRRSLIKTLSKGLRQRVGLADALVHNPSILILDEPTSGLDPAQRMEVRQLIRSLQGERTILLSTHILPEVESTCDRVIVIHGGRVLAQESISSLKNREERDLFRLKGRGTVAAAQAAGASLENLSIESAQQEGDFFTLTCTTKDRAQGRERLVTALVHAGLGILEVCSAQVSLEDVFLNLIHAEEERT